MPINKMTRNSDVQYFKTPTGFQLYANLSRIAVSNLIIPLIFLLAFIIYFGVLNPNIQLIPNIIFFILELVIAFIIALYFLIGRQSIILKYPKLKIGVSLWRFNIPLKSLDFRNIKRIYCLDKLGIDESGFGNLNFDIMNDSSNEYETITIGKNLTVAHCKRLSWHLNNYLNGVA